MVVAQTAEVHAGNVGGVETDRRDGGGDGAVVACVERAVRDSVGEDAQGGREGGEDAEENADGYDALLHRCGEREGRHGCY